MNNIIVYLPPDMESELRAKIAERLRIRNIPVTNILQDATIVIVSPDQIPSPGLSLEEIAEAMIEKTRREIFILREHYDFPDIPQIFNESKKNKNKRFINNKNFKQFNQMKHKQIFLNRTQCK